MHTMHNIENNNSQHNQGIWSLISIYFTLSDPSYLGVTLPLGFNTTLPELH